MGLPLWEFVLVLTKVSFFFIEEQDRIGHSRSVFVAARANVVMELD